MAILCLISSRAIRKRILWASIQLALFFFTNTVVLVGVIGIMYASVYKRTKEIGVLKDIGAKKKDIVSIFLAEAAIIGLAGGLVGVILGTGLAWSVGHIISQVHPVVYIETSVTLFLIVLGLLFPFAVRGIAGYLPALRATNLKPVGALRYE